MVSTEENSLSDVTAARNALLQGGMSSEALSALVGVAPWANPTNSPIEAFSYGTASTAMDELAEAALAYAHDEPNAATPRAPAGLTLVVKNDGGAEDAADDAESIAVKGEASQMLSEILRMDAEVKAGLSAEIALLTAALKSGRASGVNLDAIRDRIDAAKNNAENGKAETPEQKRERLWNEIEAANKKTLEGIDALKDNGLMDKKEADQWKDELTEIIEMPNGEEKAKRLADFNKRYGNRLQEILDSLPLDDPRRELVEGEIAREKEKEKALESFAKNTSQNVDTLQNDIRASNYNSVESLTIEVSRVTSDTAPSTTTISAAENISPADSGQLPMPEVTRVASASQSPEFRL